MKVEYFESYDVMSKRAAEIIAGELNKKSDMVLGLPTGSTPLGLYANLIEMNKCGEVDFSKVTTFNLDEYYPFKRDDKNSYYKFMFDNFFGKINIDKDRVNIPNGEADDGDVEAAEYEKKLEDCGGLDLMVLGLGANGHIGFNEPEKFLIADTHIAELTENTREQNKRFFDSIDEVPKKALTMGMGSILKAKKILIIITGEAKKEAFKQILEGKITTENPATFLNLHRDVILLTDLKFNLEDEIRKKEREAFEICNFKIEKLNLDMRLTDVKFAPDNSKITFYYINPSNKMLDWGTLVGELRAIFGKQIEVIQVKE